VLADGLSFLVQRMPLCVPGRGPEEGGHRVHHVEAIRRKDDIELAEDGGGIPLQPRDGQAPHRRGEGTRLQRPPNVALQKLQTHLAAVGEGDGVRPQRPRRDAAEAGTGPEFQYPLAPDNVGIC